MSELDMTLFFNMYTKHLEKWNVIGTRLIAKRLNTQ